MSSHCTRFHTLSFAFALGILWGVSVFIVGLLAYCFEWGHPIVNLLSSLYIGYEATVWGSFVGAVWGLIDGFIGGFIFTWLYNTLCCFFCKQC